MALTVLVNAGPWLPVPPSNYGGVENLLSYLIPELCKLGHRVLLATVGDSRIREVDEADRLSLFGEGQLRHIAEPYCDVVGIAHAHMQRVVKAIRETPGIDVIHDMLEVVGPSVLAALGPGHPPVLHSMQWNPACHRDFYRSFDGGGRVFFNCISEPQLDSLDDNLRRLTLGMVHNAVDPSVFRADVPVGDYFLTLARFTSDKGQDIAARICRDLGAPLRMAGTVAGIETPELLDKELADEHSPVHQNKDAQYYLSEVRPYEDERISWVGSVGGEQKIKLLAGARALLMPIRWEEPFGMAVIEALACGTPVVAMRRGAMPVIIQDGRNGFLAGGEGEFRRRVGQVGRISREACRQSVLERFSAAEMAVRYSELYQQVIAAASRDGSPNGGPGGNGTRCCADLSQSPGFA